MKQTPQRSGLSRASDAVIGREFINREMKDAWSGGEGDWKSYLSR